MDKQQILSVELEMHAMAAVPPKDTAFETCDHWQSHWHVINCIGNGSAPFQRMHGLWDDLAACSAHPRCLSRVFRQHVAHISVRS